jgi:hypothetical protein
MITESVHPATERAEPAARVPVGVLSRASDAELEATQAALFARMYGATAALRERFKRNDLFFQQRHWELTGRRSEATRAGLTPVTPVLFSTIDSLHADIMDAYPDVVVLGETADDAQKAAVMTDLLRYIRSRRRYRRVWRDWSLSLLVHGTAVQEVYWDKTLLGGLGDINVQHLSVRNFLWDPIVEDIEDSEAVFKICFKPAQWVADRYPDAPAPSAGPYGREAFYNDVRFADPAERPVMITEMWWKQFERPGDGLPPQPAVYMARFAGGRLLERFTDETVYAHGRYPFVVTSLVPIEGQAWGLGIPDLYGDMQSTVDRLDQILLENAELSSRVKLLVNHSAQIDENELSDWSASLIHGERIDEGAVRWFQPKPLSPHTMALMQAKMSALKEESGQNAFVRGEGGKAVTAASAIMALQEAGSKRSRNIIGKLYDAAADVADMMIRLIAEGYTERRTFLIAGDAAQRSVSAADTRRAGKDDEPIEFSVSVHVEKQVPYRAVYHDERIMQLVNIGAISPRAAVELMDFERRDEVLAAIARDDERQSLIAGLIRQNVRQRAALGQPIPVPGARAGDMTASWRGMAAEERI